MDSLPAPGASTTTISTTVFSFSMQDILQAARDYDQPRRRRRWLIFGLGIGLTLVIMACPVVIVQVLMPEYSDWVWQDFTLLFRDKPWVFWSVGALVLVAALGQPLIWRYNIGRALRLNKNQYSDLQVSFGDRGVDFTWPNASLHNEWAFYDAVIESRGYFLLVYGGLYVAVPKRAVLDVPGLAALLRQRIPAYETRG